jgi:hypothetical protein
MTFLRYALLSTMFVGALTSATDAGGETTLRLTVPKEVATHAALRAAGDSGAPPPILILEGVELGHGEGFTIKVLGPPEPGSSEPSPILAVAGMVGDRQKTPMPPLQEVTLAVPLNDRASRLLVGRSEITLTLKVTNSPGRPPLKLARAFFQVP